jgi:Plasmid pRiA4b ORF-3-like protein
MPTNKNAIPQEIYQIKVTLLGTRPPIWRRLLVPADLTLEQLHNVLQLAVGWQDCHMHDFRIGQKRFGTPDPNDRLMGLPSTASERTARLLTVLGKVGAKAVYTYDFGDSWEHGIVVEKILPPEPGHAYPACVDGKRHGPPEDCGGVPGFYNLLEAISNPGHAEHEDLQDWLGDDFDPEAFSVDEVNRCLAPLQRRRTKTDVGSVK